MKINMVKVEVLAVKNGMNFGKLAAEADLSRQTISTIKGKGACSPVTAMKLARALGVDITEILTE